MLVRATRHIVTRAGNNYAPGDEFELDDAEVAEMLAGFNPAIEVVVVAEPEPEPPKPAAKTKVRRGRKPKAS